MNVQLTRLSFMDSTGASTSGSTEGNTPVLSESKRPRSWYVKSRSDKQLLNGDSTSSTDTETCKPEQFLGELPIIPCGLIAWSLFNDTYSFTSGGHAITINKKGISWKSDREHKFGSFYPQNFPNNLPNNQNGSLIGGASLDPNVPLNENEDLIVWMRTAALPTFRKLYGRIDQNLNAHTQLSVQISNNYNTYSFDGKKKLVLSTTSWLGGKNDFLGVAYITVGSFCIFLALAFFLLHWKHPRYGERFSFIDSFHINALSMFLIMFRNRPLGDTSYLSWNRKNSG